MSQQQSLSLTTKSLHALVGSAMVGMVSLGIYMSQMEEYSLYGLHKSLGVIVFIAALTRLVWRMREGWPTPVGAAEKTQQMVARAIHYVLLISTLLFPISGFMMSGAGGRGVYLFSFELFPKNIDAVTQKVAPINESLAGLGHQMHGILTWIIVGALALHVLGALKHHFVDKDATLRRMFGKA